jgi:hypothetical protein
MWMIAFWLSMVLASATAAAFDCVGVTFHQQSFYAATRS